MCLQLKKDVFRSSVPVLNGGVSGIVVLDSGSTTGSSTAPGPPGEMKLMLCGGDGKLKKIRGRDTHWDMTRENILDGACMGLAITADKREVLVNTKQGKVYRCCTGDLKVSLHSANHTACVTQCAFAPSNSEQVCTVSEAGEMCGPTVTESGKTLISEF